MRALSRSLSLSRACLLLTALLACYAAAAPAPDPAAAPDPAPAGHSEAVDAAEHYLNSGQFPAALAAFERALLLAPADLYCLQGAATALAEMGRFAAAGQVFERAAAAGRRPQFLMNAGMSYERGRDLGRAVGAYESCLAMSQSSFRPCAVKLAGAYNQLGNFLEVQKYLQLAISLDPADFSARSHLGDVYNNLKQFGLAIEAYRAALPHAGQHAGGLLTAIADSFSNRKMHAEAKSYYDQAISFYQPGPAPAPTDLLIGKLFNTLQMGIWAGYEAAVQRVLADCAAAIARGQPSPLSPYRALFLPLPPAMALQVSQSWAAAFRRAQGADAAPAPARKPVAPGPDSTCPAPAPADDAGAGGEAGEGCAAPPPPRLRVAYMSRRFEDYPGTQMMLRLFPSHSRAALHLLAYAHGPDDGSSYRAFVRDSSDAFRDVSGLTDERAAAAIRGDDVDVLIDYDGSIHNIIFVYYHVVY
jgi:tetratricopeptide (TPR) repeat protein